MSSDRSFPQRGPTIPVLHTTTKHTIYPASSTSTTAAYGVLLTVAIYYLVRYLEAYHLPLSELLWNTVVYVTPSKMLSLLDPNFSFSARQDLQVEEQHPFKGFDSQHHASKSNSLRRLMGLDSDTGIMTAVQRTRTLSDLGSVFKQRPRRSLPGLGNWDHSCYQNSVLQGLASLESLPRFLAQGQVKDEQGKREEGPTKKALRELTDKLNEEDNIGKTLWTPSELKSMSSWQQQDAQEYFSKVMDGMEKDAATAKKIRDDETGLNALSTNDTENEKQAVSKDNESSLRMLRMKQLPAELQAIIMRNPLEGLLAQRVGCQQCGYVEGLSLVPFNCLTVPLGKRMMYDVRECLDEYTALEPINGVECAKCTLVRAKAQMDRMLSQLSSKESVDGKSGDDVQLASLQEDAQRRLSLIYRALEDEDFSDSALKKCQIPSRNYVLTTKSRQAVIARPPEALVIHINRSIFDEMTGEQSKNQASVRFPQRFGLGCWCLGSQKESSGESIEQWNTNPRQSMLDDVVDEEGLKAGPSYELRAVITHYGRHENGHYICYRKSPHPIKHEDDAVVDDSEKREPWWRLSDEEVTAVSEETVLSQGGVFMLFYEQVPAYDHLPAPISEEEPGKIDIPITELVESLLHEDSSSAISPEIKPKLEDGLEAKPCVASAYPTPPPEEFEASTEKKSPDQEQPHPTKETSRHSTPDPIPTEHLTPPPSPPLTNLTPVTHPPHHNSTENGTSEPEPEPEPEPPTAAPSPPPLPPHPHSHPQTSHSSPPLPLTANPNPPPPPPLSPRTGREKGHAGAGSTTTAMESMAGFVRAN